MTVSHERVPSTHDLIGETMNARQDPEELIIGVISDTHGLMRPEALTALAGAHRIIHAGDVEDPETLKALAQVAPLTAVRGNVDRETWAYKLPLTAAVEAGDISIYVIHDIGQLNLDPATAGFGAVVYGHSHQPSVEERRGVIYVNPGSASRKRFKNKVGIAYLKVRGREITAELIELDV